MWVASSRAPRRLSWSEGTDEHSSKTASFSDVPAKCADQSRWPKRRAKGRARREPPGDERAPVHSTFRTMRPGPRNRRFCFPNRCPRPRRVVQAFSRAPLTLTVAEFPVPYL
jgi:hypothetical protein